MGSCFKSRAVLVLQFISNNPSSSQCLYSHATVHSTTTDASHATVLSDNTSFKGTYQSESSLRVCGRTVGSLATQGCIAIAQAAVVEGTVHAHEAVVAGTFYGDLHVEDLLVLTHTARIGGQVKTGRLRMDEGALILGACEIRIGTAPDAPTPPSATDVPVQELIPSFSAR